jgi:hypothetical protein
VHAFYNAADAVALSFSMRYAGAPFSVGGAQPCGTLGLHGHASALSPSCTERPRRGLKLGPAAWPGTGRRPCALALPDACGPRLPTYRRGVPESGGLLAERGCRAGAPRPRRRPPRSPTPARPAPCALSPPRSSLPRPRQAGLDERGALLGAALRAQYGSERGAALREALAATEQQRIVCVDVDPWMGMQAAGGISTGQNMLGKALMALRDEARA